jgi:hypothetical protein
MTPRAEQVANAGRERPDEPEESHFPLRSEAARARSVGGQASRPGPTVAGRVRRAVTARLEQDEATGPGRGGE